MAYADHHVGHIGKPYSFGRWCRAIRMQICVVAIDREFRVGTIDVCWEKATILCTS